jgi:hypothetical protein
MSNNRYPSLPGGDSGDLIVTCPRLPSSPPPPLHFLAHSHPPLAQASSCALGAAHPPGQINATRYPNPQDLHLFAPALLYSNSLSRFTGYPTFVILGSIFTMLPFNSVAWRVNLVSVISGTVASAAL